MNMRNLTLLVAFGAVIYGLFLQGNDTRAPREAVAPNWAAISAWPGIEAAEVAAQPDPNRRITAIVLDDSGSMGGDIEPAKRAVVGALDAMEAQDRVAVLSLNNGQILGFTSVAEARNRLPNAIAPIRSDGGTPLTRAVSQARALLEQEAASMRGFGTYRLIVTTDGKADDGVALDALITELATATPVQLTTIGIGISGNHVLRRSDLASFVDVANVDALQDALQAAVAENADFTAITDFTATGE